MAQGSGWGICILKRCGFSSCPRTGTELFWWSVTWSVVFWWNGYLNLRWGFSACWTEQSDIDNSMVVISCFLGPLEKDLLLSYGRTVIMTNRIIQVFLLGCTCTDWILGFRSILLTGIGSWPACPNVEDFGSFGGGRLQLRRLSPVAAVLLRSAGSWRRFFQSTTAFSHWPTFAIIRS